MDAIGPVRVVMAEPDVDLRRELSSYLSSVGGIQIVREASSPGNTLALAKQLCPDLVLAGFPLTSPVEIEFVSRIRGSLTSGALILLVSSEGGSGEIFNAITVGAVACIPRDTSPEFIASTLQRVGQGEQPIQYTLLGSHDVASRVLNWIWETGQRPYVAISSPCPLSHRELQVLHQVAQGLTNREIGARLHISEQTAKNHLSAIMRKTGAHDRAHAAVLSL